VADDTVREAVDEITPDDEFEAARRLVRARLAATKGDDPARRVRRLAGLLARKGYGAGLAMSAVREELRAESRDRQATDGLEAHLGLDVDLDVVEVDLDD